MGFSPQNGLPQNSRVGDLDSTAASYAIKVLSISADDALSQLSKCGGLLGIGGVSDDMREIKAAADAVSFSGGIAENNPWLRERILFPLSAFGLEIDTQKNASLKKAEGVFSSETSKIKAVALVADEEFVVAREAAMSLAKNTPSR